MIKSGKYFLSLVVAVMLLGLSATANAAEGQVLGAAFATAQRFDLAVLAAVGSPSGNHGSDHKCRAP